MRIGHELNTGDKQESITGYSALQGMAAAAAVSSWLAGNYQ